MPEQAVRVPDQGVDQLVPGGLVVPGDRRVSRGRRSHARCTAAAITSAAPGTSRRTRRIAAINWVTVSWVATASSRIVESSARRVFPVSAPVCADHRLHRVEDPVRLLATRPAGAASTSTSSGWNAAAVTGNPHAAFHRRSNVTASTVSASDNPCSACNVITVAITSAGTDGRPDADGNRSANIPSGNNSRRCAARNANTLPGFSRCPATDSTSNRSR